MEQADVDASKSGRILTVVLIVVAVIAALYLALGNSGQQEPQETPDVRTGVRAWSKYSRSVWGVMNTPCRWGR